MARAPPKRLQLPTQPLLPTFPSQQTPVTQLAPQHIPRPMPQNPYNQMQIQQLHEVIRGLESQIFNLKQRNQFLLEQNPELPSGDVGAYMRKVLKCELCKHNQRIAEDQKHLAAAQVSMDILKSELHDVREKFGIVQVQLEEKSFLLKYFQAYNFPIMLQQMHRRLHHLDERQRNFDEVIEVVATGGVSAIEVAQIAMAEYAELLREMEAYDKVKTNTIRDLRRQLKERTKRDLDVEEMRRQVVELERKHTKLEETCAEQTKIAQRKIGELGRLQKQCANLESTLNSERAGTATLKENLEKSTAKQLALSEMLDQTRSKLDAAQKLMKAERAQAEETLSKTRANYRREMEELKARNSKEHEAEMEKLKVRCCKEIAELKVAHEAEIRTELQKLAAQKDAERKEFAGLIERGISDQMAKEDAAFEKTAEGMKEVIRKKEATIQNLMYNLQERDAKIVLLQAVADEKPLVVTTCAKCARAEPAAEPAQPAAEPAKPASEPAQPAAEPEPEPDTTAETASLAANKLAEVEIQSLRAQVQDKDKQILALNAALQENVLVETVQHREHEILRLKESIALLEKQVEASQAIIEVHNVETRMDIYQVLAMKNTKEKERMLTGLEALIFENKVRVDKLADDLRAMYESAKASRQRSEGVFRSMSQKFCETTNELKKLRNQDKTSSDAYLESQLKEQAWEAEKLRLEERLAQAQQELEQTLVRAQQELKQSLAEAQKELEERQARAQEELEENPAEAQQEELEEKPAQAKQEELEEKPAQAKQEELEQSRAQAQQDELEQSFVQAKHELEQSFVQAKQELEEKLTQATQAWQAEKLTLEEILERTRQHASKMEEKFKSATQSGLYLAQQLSTAETELSVLKETASPGLALAKLMREISTKVEAAQAMASWMDERKFVSAMDALEEKLGKTCDTLDKLAKSSCYKPMSAQCKELEVCKEVLHKTQAQRDDLQRQLNKHDHNMQLLSHQHDEALIQLASYQAFVTNKEGLARCARDLNRGQVTRERRTSAQEKYRFQFHYIQPFLENKDSRAKWLVYYLESQQEVDRMRETILAQHRGLGYPPPFEMALTGGVKRDDQIYMVINFWRYTHYLQKLIDLVTNEAELIDVKLISDAVVSFNIGPSARTPEERASRRDAIVAAFERSNPQYL